MSQEIDEVNDLQTPRSNTVFKVVLIIGALGLLSCVSLGGLVGYFALQAKSKALRVMEQVRANEALLQIGIAQEAYHAEKGAFAPDIATLVSTSHLPSAGIPGSENYLYEMEVAQDGKNGFIFASPLKKNQGSKCIRYTFPTGDLQTAESKKGPWK